MTSTLLFLVFLELWDAFPTEFGHELSDFPSKDRTVSPFNTLKNSEKVDNHIDGSFMFILTHSIKNYAMNNKFGSVFAFDLL